MQDEDIKELAASLVSTAQKAGRAILKYRHPEAQVDYKGDGSPVTAADCAAEEIILADLAELAPDYVVIAEESVDKASAAFDPAKPFFLVDPLDGTKDFIRGGTDFTVNIALIREREPVFGLIYAPASERLFLTRARGEAVSAELDPEGRTTASELDMTPIWTREPDREKLCVLASRSHLNEATSNFISRLHVAETLQFSSSLKFCILAAGTADIYPRLAPTSEWDTAAGQAILCAAGGIVVGEDGEPLTYGHVERKFLNPGFVAAGRHLAELDIAPVKV